MKRLPLKSRLGCSKCKARRVKCDEQKPICGHCARLGFPCRWPVPDKRPAKADPLDELLPATASDADDDDTVIELPIVKLPVRQRDSLHDLEVYKCLFDSPSILRTNAVPHGGDENRKLVLQYIAEQGAAILKIPNKRFATHDHVNLFKEGFGLAAVAPLHMQALICVGAGHLANTSPTWEEFALRHYNRVMAKLRAILTKTQNEPPTEWMCAVVSILSFYELVAFHSPQSRLAHLVAFHRLVEARISHDLPWLPLKILPEQYVHSMANNSLFHYDLLVGKKPISWLDTMVSFVNDVPRPSGSEIAGVPEELTAAAYRLAALNTKDITQAPWDVELLATAVNLVCWTPPPHALEPSGAPLLLVGKLYHFACTCLLQHITNRTSDAAEETISESLYEASYLLQESEYRLEPFNSMIWPLTILAIFVTDRLQRAIIRQSITSLVNISKVQGYHTILRFLTVVEEEKLGPKVLLRPDLLRMVHM